MGIVNREPSVHQKANAPGPGRAKIPGDFKMTKFIIEWSAFMASGHYRYGPAERVPVECRGETLLIARTASDAAAQWNKAFEGHTGQYTVREVAT